MTKPFRKSDLGEILDAVKNDPSKHASAHQEFGLRFKDIVSPYCKHTNKLATVLRNTKAVITDFNATAFIFHDLCHNQKRGRQYSLQISTTQDTAAAMLGHLMQVQGYMIKQEFQNPCELYQDNEGVTHEYELTNGITYIDVVVVSSTVSALYAIPSKSTTAYMNALHPDFFLCFYPELSLYRRGVFHNSCFVPQRPSRNIGPRQLLKTVQNQVKELTSLDFQLQDSFTFNEPHQCLHNSCRLRRSTNDILNISFQTPFDLAQLHHWTPTVPIQREMIWSLGGFRCDADMTVDDPYEPFFFFN